MKFIKVSDLLNTDSFLIECIRIWIKSMFYSLILILFSITLLTVLSAKSYSKGKIYGNSKTLSKEYKKYEICRLLKTEENVKDDRKDGYKCIYKRQTKGKDVTIFQDSIVCQKSFKCKVEFKLR